MEQQLIDLSKMNVQELKAFAYDQLVIFNQTQANIAAIEAEIKRRAEQLNGDLLEKKNIK